VSDQHCASEVVLCFFCES